MGRKLAIGLVIVVVIGAGLVLSGGQYHVRLGEHHVGLGHGKHAGHHGRRGGMERTIIVGGSGAVLAAPDTANLSIGVETFSVDSGKALDENNGRMTKVIKGLKSLGLTTDEIQTSGFSLRRETDKEKGRPGFEDGFIGYSVSNNIQVRTSQIDLIEGILDQFIGWGATELNSLRFSVEDDSTYLAIARANAVQDARRHAKELVDASGAELGEVLRIDDGGERYRDRRSPTAVRSDVLDDDAPVFLTTETVYAWVTVTFRIR